MLGTITLTVGQQEPPNVLLNEGPENTEVSPEDAASKDGMKQDGVEETPEANSTTPESEDKSESPEETSENQSNEVGFKKVFKFVGFKFTVKKEKTEKSDPVQLLTVKKDEVETNGTDNLEIQSSTPEESKPEETQEPKDASPESETVAVSAQEVESPQETTDDKLERTEDPKVEKEQKKSPVSPTNPLTTETSSPFKRFFTQGWAGLRKKTSFRKSKEEDPQEVEKHINSELQAKIEGQDVGNGNLTEDSQAEAVIIEAQPAQLDGDQPEKEVETIIDEGTPTSSVEQPKQEESLDIKLDEPKATEEEQTECAAHVAESVLPEAEITENIVAVVVENVVTVTKELTEIILESDIAEEKTIIALSEVSSTASPPNVEEIQVVKPDTELNDKSVDSLTVEQSQVASNPECAELEKSHNAITTEAELLSSQEKAKLQGSPLRKLFSSSGLRKLSAKKHKSKKDDDAKVEDVAPEAPASSESPEVPDADGGESSPSSPEESGETSPTDIIPEDSQQIPEVDGDGITSDGERKRDGITPWASFKKLVTPKKRPKRPSESDKEDEVEKVKSSTMSSTDSAGYVENQEEVKENNEEQKLEKSTEENKKKVDSSVSWEALICVGSSKRRARKTSDSEEELPNTLEENKITEEDIANAKELDSEGPPVSSQEKEQDSSSPDQANSPTDGDGVSTWQSFKRLVTPRRKSKSKAEDKIEEPTVTSSVEQSTSEGEAGKDETWVSLKKFIPGRKKKRSDAKADQGPLNEGGLAIPSETVEDDSDEPAVVPLAEFDAAEQEKLEAQQSALCLCALNDVSTELVPASENSEELVHAVTVTVIEGERAVTSLEERSPSWISATVSETVEKDNFPVEEPKEEIKSEVKVEEHVIFTSVSQVATEAKDTIISDVEMTAEAITALEEAIENSYAEETTEMISAVSQLGESVVTTEDATPVPEDESAKSLEERKKQTDQILQEVAEKAQLSAIAIIESSTKLLDRSSVSANVADFGEIQAQDTRKGGKTVDEEKSIVKDNVAEFQISQTVCITTFTERSTILPVVASPSLLEMQNKDDSSTVDQNVKEIVLLSHQKGGDISISTETNASEDIIVWRKEQTREETFAEKHTVEGLHISGDKDAGVELVLVTDEDQAAGGSPCLEEKEGDFVLISAEEPNKQITVSTAEKQANEPMSVSVDEQEKEDMPSWSTEQIQEITFSKEQTSNLVNLASLDNRNYGAFISRVEKTGSDLPILSVEKTEELIKTEIYTLEKKESAPLLSEKHGEKHTSFEIQVKEAVSVSAKEMTCEDAAILPEEQSRGFASTVAEQQTDESPTVVSEKSADEVKPILDKADNCTIHVEQKECEDVQELVLGDEGTPVVSEKENAENLLVVTTKPAEDLYQVYTEKEAGKDHVLSAESVELAAELTVAPADGSSGMFADKEVSDIGERPADEGLHVLTEEQAENITILSERKSEVVDIAVSQVQESSQSFTEKTFDGTSEVEDNIVEEIKPVLIEEQTETLHVLFTEKADACDLALEHAEESHVLADKPFDEEEQVENAHVISEEKVDLTVDKADGSATIVTEKQTFDFSDLAEVKADVSPVLTKKLDSEDALLAEAHTGASVPPFSVEGLTRDSDFVLAEKQTANISPGFTDKDPVLDKEQVKDVKEKVDESEFEGQIKADILSLDIQQTAESESILIDNLTLEKESLECISNVIELHTEEGNIVLQNLEVEGGTTGPTDESLTSEKTKCVLTEEPIVLIAKKNVISVLIHQEKESPIKLAEVDADENVQKSQKSMESDAVLKEQESVCVETEQIESDSKPVAPSGELHLESIPVSLQKEEITPVSLDGQPDKSIHILQEQETSLCKTLESTIVPDVISNVAESVEPVTDISQDEETDLMKILTDIDRCANARETEMELKNDIGVEAQLGDLKRSAAVCQGTSTHSTVVEEELKMIEEMATTEIPELESAEANKASEPFVAAAVEEQVLAESVKPIEIPSETTSLNQTAENVNIISSEEYEITPGTLQTVESVSQKAAAIVDAAIEAAAGCLTLDNISQVPLEQKSVTQNGFSVSWDDQQSIHTESVEEKGTVETITIESHSTTIVHKIIETAVEKVVNSGQNFLICNTVESKSQEEKHSSGDQQAVVFSSSSSKEISVEPKQDYQPPSSELDVTACSTIAGQIEKEIVCEVLKVVTTTTCIEHHGKVGVDDPQKEAFVELETKDNVKEDLIQEQDVSALLEHESGKERSTGDHETVRLSSFPDQTSSETVQIIQPEIKSSVPAYTLEEEISTQDDCIDVRTQDVSKIVES
uniref:A-kinase anchoring protein 12 n=1 Tax=Leptobrachium leishanense TaxID=445787 RepID=A0A8C5R4N3_9ANUR